MANRIPRGTRELIGAAAVVSVWYSYEMYEYRPPDVGQARMHSRR